MRTKKKGRPSQPESIILVIDLGTGTIFTMVVYPDGRQELLSDWDGNIPTLTAIGFEDADPEKPIFGAAAIQYMKIAPYNVVTISKRTRGQNTVLLVDKNGKGWTGEELEAVFVKRIAQHTEERIGLNIAAVLVSVPSCFTDAQRRSTIQIVENAGYKSIGTLNESTGAVLFYTVNKGLNGNYIVVDIGTGTSDVTIVHTENGDTISVLATAGRDDLAGREMTQSLVSLCIAEMKEHGVVLDPEKDFRELLLLNSCCEQAKHALSSQEKAYLSWYAANQLFDLEVTRKEYDSAIQPILGDIERLIHESMSMANLTVESLDGVVMAGGASRTPAVRKMLEKIFSPEKVFSDLDPDQAIVRGAAMSVGHKIHEGIAAGDHALKAISENFELIGDINLQDILGKALGVQAMNTRTQEEVLAPIADANTPLPFSGSKLFGLQNGGHGMVNVEIIVLQGNAGAPAHTARVLAKFSLVGLPPGPLENRIEIFFDIDGNGLVKVRAVDTFSGQEISGEVVTTDAIQKIA